MKPGKIIKRTALAVAAVRAAVLASFKPTPRQLLDPRWHREIPVRLVGRGLARLLPMLYERQGERGVRRLQYVFYRFGLDRGPLMQKYLEIDPEDARSLGRVLDYEDGLGGVRGIWSEECKGRAVKDERYCPITREMEKCPEVCTKLMIAMEAGTFAAINPAIRLPYFTELLSTGGSCCRVAIEIPGLSEEEAPLESPRATHDTFAPRVNPPGLRWRFLLTGAASPLKALAKLAVTDIDDIDMLWYESFRYRPPEIS